jgi:hypothetical protein
MCLGVYVCGSVYVMWVWVCVCGYVCVWVCYVDVGMCLCYLVVCMYVDVCMWVCVCVWVYVCGCVYGFGGVFMCVGVCMCLGKYLCFFNIFTGMLHYIVISNTTCYLHLVFTLIVSSLLFVLCLSFGLLLVHNVLVSDLGCGISSTTRY